MRVVAYLIGGGTLVLAINYGLALAGEPQSVWLMRDILGVMG